jgi:hypothetical protein
MTRFKLPREFYVPKGATKVADKQSDAVAFLYADTKGRPCGRVFYGKQTKPILACYFRDNAQREKSITVAFENRRAFLTRKNGYRDERKNFVHDYKVGDIFRTSWGYDQTNVEYFQITEVKGKHVIMREIAQERVDTSYDQGKCVPLKDQFLKPRYEGDDAGLPIRRLAQKGGIKIDSVRYAYPIDTIEVAGIKVAKPAYFSTGH